ncbi:hypothetical protein VTN00DRAFT_6971 [Thermoascus crustaceus]|uniref:uncharacterized protein n=1 Tax=Thermoascus crustaceus TaxID=5088 RepID=UPI003743278C
MWSIDTGSGSASPCPNAGYLLPVLVAVSLSGLFMQLIFRDSKVLYLASAMWLRQLAGESLHFVLSLWGVFNFASLVTIAKSTTHT